MKRILILEDDRALSAGIALALRGDGVEFAHAEDLRAARVLLNRLRFDLCILDVNLPDGSGLELLPSLRGAVPVILLTANDLEGDVVAGLRMGADDYITKPFSLAVLRARVEVQLRRAGGVSAYREGPYVFDFDRMEFTCGGRRLELSRTEQRVLRLLVERRGTVVPRAQLLDRGWPDGTEYVEENALSVTIKRLRDKLGGPACIRTVYGVGYAWGAP